MHFCDRWQRERGEREEREREREGEREGEREELAIITPCSGQLSGHGDERERKGEFCSKEKEEGAMASTLLLLLLLLLWPRCLLLLLGELRPLFSLFCRRAERAAQLSELSLSHTRGKSTKSHASINLLTLVAKGKGGEPPLAPLGGGGERGFLERQQQQQRRERREH